jgi:oxygen-dependent protoporphyrinogen oxidase
MKKQIVIIGAGISGLSLLHYLHQRYLDREDVQLTLLEKNDYAGGTIRCLQENRFLFEMGPNGFLDTKKRSLELVTHLQLTERLLQASQQNQVRYINIGRQLHAIPQNPGEFLFTKLFTLGQKLRILAEWMIPRRPKEDDSVFEFARRRLGKAFAEKIFDPMVSGIYAANSKQLNLRAAFPTLYEWENKYGSLLKAFINIKREKRKVTGSQRGSPGALMSFVNGMPEIVTRIASLYKRNIQFNRDVRSIFCEKGVYLINADGQKYNAHELYVCSPAYATAGIIRGMDVHLSQGLGRISYAPVAVVGLGYRKEDIQKIPRGFGYLVPSSEQKEVIGVIFESNIFSNRCPYSSMLFRVMLGGMHHPDILKKTQQQLVLAACREIETMFGISAQPEHQSFVRWEKAIPQYDQDYVAVIADIKKGLSRWPNLFLVANYVNGVSFNDCIENAYQASLRSNC